LRRPDNLTVGTATNASELYVGDFTKVVCMMREQMSIQVAKELFAATGEIVFICHVRVDVAMLYLSAFAVVTGVKP
jgi:HK97 family phage major capsid protein